MKIGVHLPTTALSGQELSMRLLKEFARSAESLGYDTLAIVDHINWLNLALLDGIEALTVAASVTSSINLTTSVALPILKGPLSTAKSLASLAVLSEGRLVAGIGPGSVDSDLNLIGIPAEQKWARFDEAVSLIRAVFKGEPFLGNFYAIDRPLHPIPTPAPPILIASWGSERGIERVSRLGDGWISSAFNIQRTQLKDIICQLRERKKAFPVLLSTMFTYITESKTKKEHIIRRLAEILKKPPDLLNERTLIGSKAEIVQKIQRLEEAGIDEIFLLFLGDELAQLRRFITNIRTNI